jgi:hypothetical protein
VEFASGQGEKQIGKELYVYGKGGMHWEAFG